MSDYNQVKQALASGAEPAMLCTTCPWDRNCVSPPEMSEGDVTQKLDETAAAARKSGQDAGAAVLLASLIYVGRDTALQACPVLALRLRAGDGRKIAAAVRNQMQTWEES